MVVNKLLPGIKCMVEDIATIVALYGSIHEFNPIGVGHASYITVSTS